MQKDAVSATYKGGYKIEITFENAVSGIVDFLKFLHRGGVFNKFNDTEFFMNFRINRELGVLTWGDDVDIAHETLYAEATNFSLPEWVELHRGTGNCSPDSASAALADA